MLHFISCVKYLLETELKIGTVIETIPVAILKLIDDGEMDYKIIAIPKDPNQRVINATTYEKQGN